MRTTSLIGKAGLLAGVAPLGLLLATPAFAQDATNAPGTQTQPKSAAGQATTTGPVVETSPDIVVTGTLFRRRDNDTPSPVSTINAANLDQRGISTIQDAVQQLASNNGPALTNNFTSNGAFAAGASAVSLRGLSTNSTLVLFDGMRAAYYPLADDGSRNFVDLNTVPDDIVDRVEVLRDGASSSYGADAIAGVVNVITKKNVTGVSMRAEAGVSSRGDAPEHRISLTAGVGDLDRNGYNAYISGFYYNSAQLMNNERPYPYNSNDLRGVCNANGKCGPDNRVNGFNSLGLISGISTAGNFVVRPYDATNSTAQGAWQNLGPCVNGSVYALNAADKAYTTTSASGVVTVVNANTPSTVCQVDRLNQYRVTMPNIERFGLSARITAKLGSNTEAYAEANFLQSQASYTGYPATYYGAAPTGILYPQYRTSGLGGGAYVAGSNFLTLPVYVCPRGTTVACTVANGKLNPQNPFAAQGQVARVIGTDLGTTTFNETRSRAYRFAAGVHGSITDNWSFDVSGTAMHIDLKRLAKGYVYIQHLLDAVADGSFNFANPAANSQAERDFVSPDNTSTATSDEDQLQANVSGALAQLGGGSLQLGVGASIRYEAVDTPSFNPDYNGPTQRYFTLNAFGTKGHRYVSSVFGELDAPIAKQIDVNLSGRYDHYSTGQSAFSPKIGVIFTPVRQLTLRGTYSRGFRIPSFGEANALPTTGYVSNSAAVFNDAYLAQYGCTKATFASACPIYIRSGSYGQTTLASPNLQPEKSRSFTGGIKFDPLRNVSIMVDYYNIKKTGAITQPSNSPALTAYYSGQAIPAGYTVIADAPDPNTPNAKPRVAFVQAQLINANTIKVEGLDFSVDARFHFGHVTWTSAAEASLILNLSTTFPDGTTERYDGTLGNYNLTSGSGTPKWHGNWQNTLDFGQFAVTGTVNYFGGYDQSAMDQGTGYEDCGLAPAYISCHTKSYITFDLNAQVKVNRRFTVYGTMLNVFDRLPPFDPNATYGNANYNVVTGSTGILGRYFKAGVKVGF